MKIKWGRSDDGFIESKCGRFEISPNFWGRCNPLDFTVNYIKDNKRIKICSGCDTQKEAKQEAEKYIEREQL